tara:strand:+ start:107 stop:733 length:627 start_codon:yes stop_codon:yes gene_type:complete
LEGLLESRAAGGKNTKKQTVQAAVFREVDACLDDAFAFRLVDSETARTSSQFGWIPHWNGEHKPEGCGGKALEIVEHRIRELEAATAAPPPNICSVDFPTAVHSDHRVQSFLRGPERTMVLQCGAGINHARTCAMSLRLGSPRLGSVPSLRLSTLNARTFSVNADADGRGSRAVVLLTKTPTLNQHRASAHKANVKELQQLQSELSAW